MSVNVRNITVQEIQLRQERLDGQMEETTVERSWGAWVGERGGPCTKSQPGSDRLVCRSTPNVSPTTTLTSPSFGSFQTRTSGRWGSPRLVTGERSYAR